MVVALIALLVALGGSAVAASGGFESSDGTIQGCISRGSLLTPKGTVLVVAPGAGCPNGTTPQSFASGSELSEVFAASDTVNKTLGQAEREMTEVALPAGDYLVNGKADFSDSAAASVGWTVTCVLVGPAGKAIAGSASSATVPADASGYELALPITAVVSNLPAGNLALDCKDSPPPTSGSSARAAIAAPSQARASTEPRGRDATEPEPDSPGQFQIVGNSLVSAQMLFLGSADKVYIVGGDRR